MNGGTQLTTGSEYLTERAITYFSANYGGPVISSPGLVRGVSWSPSLSFSINTYLTVCGEASDDKAYPEVLRLRNADVLAVHEPISIYSVTTDEVFFRAAEQEHVRELEKHGYGLLTVSDDGTVQRRIIARPLVQHISKQEFVSITKGLPSSLRQQVSSAFDTYSVNPSSGVAQLSEVVEGMITRAYKDGHKRGWLKKRSPPGTTSLTLDAIGLAVEFGNAAAALGGARAFYSDYRNLTHHFPRNKRKAHKKYCDCRHGFLEGLKRIEGLRSAMRKLNLSGLL